MTEKKLSEELRHCLDGDGCKDCSNYQLESRLTCPTLLQKAYEVVKRYEEMYEIMRPLAERLNEYTVLEEQGKLLKLPCAVGDFALFSDGSILPVTYITISDVRGGIVIGCQNGINISMNLQYRSWCKGFFKTRPEAEQALAEMEGKK